MSPNLATVYDVGVVGGEVFIAFEPIDGTTLGAWARAGRSVAARLAALAAAGRGLAAAHSAGVIHRDFKPDNGLVAHDGAVKVIDFGLARGIGEAGVVAPQRRPARDRAVCGGQGHGVDVSAATPWQPDPRQLSVQLQARRRRDHA